MNATETTSQADILQLLTPFCSTHPTRSNIAQPWTRHGYTWATDGAIVLRVPAQSDITGPTDAPDPGTLWTAYPEQPPEAYHPLPDLPDDAGNPALCPECGGNSEDYCEECENERTSPDPRWTLISDIPFSLHYLGLMRRHLGTDLRVAVGPVVGRKHSGFLRFKFPGGEGIVLARYDSVRTKEVAHQYPPPPAASLQARLEAAEAAVIYALGRIRDEPVIHYHCGPGTQLHALLVASLALTTGQTHDQVIRQHRPDPGKMAGWRAVKQRTEAIIQHLDEQIHLRPSNHDHENEPLTVPVRLVLGHTTEE